MVLSELSAPAYCLRDVDLIGLSNWDLFCNCTRCLRDKMHETGWCPHQTNYLVRRYDYPIFSNLANLKPPEEPNQHHKCESSSFCTAYNVDMRNYKTRHVHTNCKCAMIKVPQKDLIDVLRQGGTPLISIDVLDNASAEAGGGLRLRVHPGYRQNRWRKTVERYVAISHVWAQGLGNPTENALPACQLFSLKKRLKKLNSGSLIWMDTLCIPVQEADKGLKMRTIHNMARTYAMAHAVLVLDQGLMSLKSTSLGNELYPNILCSMWMRRSWTLQEGILAQRCMFQFHDRTLVLRNNLHAPFMSESWIDRTHVFSSSATVAATAKSPCRETLEADLFVALELKKSLSRDMICFDRRGWLSDNFQHDWIRCDGRNSDNFACIWNALAGRSTTMSDDLYLIFANVFGYQTESLFPLSTSEKKLRRIIFSFNKLPVSLLFCAKREPSEDLVSVNGWIPSEFGRELLPEGDRGMSVNIKHHPDFVSFGLANDVYDMYIAEATILASARCTISYENTLHVVERLFQPTTDPLVPYGYVLIIVAKRRTGVATYRCGTCLSITSKNIENGCLLNGPKIKEILYVKFCFSIRVHELSGEFRGESLHPFGVRKVEMITEVRLKCEIEPEFEPLPWRGGFDIESPDGGRRALPWLLVPISFLAVVTPVLILFPNKTAAWWSGVVVGIVLGVPLISLFLSYYITRQIFVSMVRRRYAQSFG